MGSLVKPVTGKFLVDSIHGDVHLTEKEWSVIDTSSFQRLRSIKQLQMSHLTYPNATHTRFSHSIGTLAIMIRVIQLAVESGIKVSISEQENLRLAALLHDIGHYPYSHLMEGIEKVILLEEKVATKAKREEKKHLSFQEMPYPEHVPLGVQIVRSQEDILHAIGGKKRAKAITDIFSRSVLDAKLSTLISSSLDLDRFDYLQRDSYAVGLPYGKLDINYLLNSLKIGIKGTLGVHDRAIPAVEHFLLARYFMHRTVYYHRTTVAFEEACRQLLRRVRDKGKYGMPKDGDEINRIVSSADLFKFNDTFIDLIIREASSDEDDIIRILAKSIQERNAPKLLKEVLVLEEKGSDSHFGLTFRDRCYSEIADFAEHTGFEIGRFLFCEPKPISFEKMPSHHTVKEYRALTSEDELKHEREEEEIVQVFEGDSQTPKSLLEVKHSIIKHLSSRQFRIYRLYFVSDTDIPKSRIAELKTAVKDWDQHR